MTHDRLEFDFNIVKPAIRPQATTRINSPFAGSDDGGRTTLLQTATVNSANPQAWLTQTLGRLANAWPSSENRGPYAAEPRRLNGPNFSLTLVVRISNLVLIDASPLVHGRAMTDEDGQNSVGLNLNACRVS